MSHKELDNYKMCMTPEREVNVDYVPSWNL